MKTEKPKHTPGPCECYVHVDIYTTKTGIKFCPLHEAAPEMLKALKAVLPQIEWANVHGSRCEELLGLVKAAIAKAEGK